MAHRAAKERPEQINQQGTDAAGRTTGCSYWSLVTQTSEWHSLWTDQSSPAEMEEAITLLNDAIASCPSTLPPITGEDVLKASKGFKLATVAPDGWHPRTFGLMGPEGREATAQLLNLFEQTGQWPTMSSSVSMKATRKPCGGSRLIGWYRAMFRLWSYIRSEVWRGWEDAHASQQFSRPAEATASLMLVG